MAKKGINCVFDKISIGEHQREHEKIFEIIFSGIDIASVDWTLLCHTPTQATAADVVTAVAAVAGYLGLFSSCTLSDIFARDARLCIIIEFRG